MGDDDAATAVGATLFWEGDCGALLEKALASPDKPIRISAAALVLRMGEGGAGASKMYMSPAVEEGVALLTQRRRELISRLPGLVSRARVMLEAACAVVHVELDHNDEGQLECPD